MKHTLPAIAALALLAAGCSASADGSAPPRGATPAPSSYAPEPGADAAMIAGHIPGCTDVAAGTVGQGGPKLSSTATCTFDGHMVIIDSWAGAGDANIAALASEPIYFAYGSTWTAFVADQGAPAGQTTMQEQLSNDAATLLAEATDGDPYPPADIDAEQSIAHAVADALGGKIGHSQG